MEPQALSDSCLEVFYQNNFEEIGYSTEDFMALHERCAFCYTCFRYRFSWRFPTNSRFRTANKPTMYCSRYASETKGFERYISGNKGTRKCIDCLADEGLPNSDEPWLVNLDDATDTRGHCSKCRTVFRGNYFKMDKDQRHEI